METSRLSSFLVSLLVIAVVLLAIGIWWTSGSPAPLTTSQSTPAPAAGSAVAIGSKQCAECHVEQFSDYQSSGHAKTLWSTSDFPFRERFDGLMFTDAERQKTYQYYLNESGLDVVVPGEFGGDRFPLQFAFGSGQHAITFVSLTPDGSGVPTGIEHRVTWFTGMDHVDITPGQLGRTVDHPIECFGRVIRGETLERCFECHTTSGRIEGDAVVDLIPNVGCENCHSQGAHHAALMLNGNPAESKDGFEHRPWRTADQIKICAQCHRGEESVKESDIRPDNPKIVRFQPVGLLQSKCYLQSKQPMTCSTCHNPHQHAAKQSPMQYEKKCLQCHSSAADSSLCSVSPDSDCVSCHMPRIEVHPSISFHDHWIRVRDASDPPSVPSETDDEQ